MNVRPEVMRFAELMESKLRRNDHKSQWKSLGTANLQWFIKRLKDEVAELEEAISNEGPEEIEYESADVANFAMMIADIIRRGGSDVGVCNNELERAEEKGIPGQVCLEKR